MLKRLARLVPSSILSPESRAAKDLAVINSLETGMAQLSDDALREKTAEFQRRLDGGENIEKSIKHEAFAVVREAAKRVLGKRPYDVQIIGGLILYSGRIAEMRTGEGKTLTAAMPTYLAALEGKGVHVITVNDYLATRDAEQIGRVHRFLGLTVGVIVPGLDDGARRVSYAADITYGTNSEFGFDYLRDNLRFDVTQMVQRGQHYAIVDEVDSILIDEARTPLIISEAEEDAGDTYRTVDAIIKRLKEGRDYVRDEKMNTVALTEEGQDLVERGLRADGILAEGVALYQPETTYIVHHVHSALKAHGMFHKDKDYVVRDGEIVIVDENTGRMMDGRRFSAGIHQALEAKEGIEVRRESATLTSITYQNFFRLYTKLSGMTGTAATEREELAEVYGLDVSVIPTHRPVVRIDEADEVHLSASAKYNAIIEEVRRANDNRQPVLIGTASIEKSELLASLLEKAGFERGNFHDIARGKTVFQVLNAHNHALEADIVAHAGVPGAITIATNMAGRGTDIELGGNFERISELLLQGVDDEGQRAAIRAGFVEQHARVQNLVRERGGLLVIGTERHESRRVDNQLRGRSGRQGDPGRARFFVSLEDDIVRVFGSEKIGKLARTLGLQEGDAVSHPLITKMLEASQKKVESRNYDIRKDVVKYDNINNDQRKAINSYRQDIMSQQDVTELVEGMRESAVDRVIAKHIPHNAYPEQWDGVGLAADLERLLDLKLPVADWMREEGVTEVEVRQKVEDAYAQSEEARRASLPDGLFEHARKMVLLQNLDQHWKQHLSAMEELRDVINFRSYAQREPLQEYRTEAFAMFEALVERLEDAVTEMASRVVARAVDPTQAAA